MKMFSFRPFMRFISQTSLIPLLATFLAIFTVNNVEARAFDTCPSEAFLIQDKVASLYNVDLATGYFQKSTPLDWNQKKMNAMGFNYHDAYLYAYNSYFGSIVKIDADYKVTPLWPENMPQIGFYVGDIAVSSNTYYLYRPGSNYGLYRIELDSDHTDYMQMIKIVSGSDLSMNIFDFAFHPENGLIYAVDRWGNLLRINPDIGNSTKISNIGQSGVFGAVYFDVSGNLYVSRNNDGHIFRVNTNSNYPVAEFFAYGPASGNNDGARCALAPIIDVEVPTTDFGKAPDSYGTSINNNGARHNITSSNLYLGASVYGEPNAYADNGYDNSDDDGVKFVTDLATGQIALVEVTASESGYLSAWIDFDRDGNFDDDEKVFNDKKVFSGIQMLSLSVPNWSEFGSSWSRFRLSSETNVPATGGVSSGEVEDYPVELTSPNTTVSHYPNANDWATIAFEDNWPLVGDYDMNDLVMQYRLAQYDALDNVQKISIDGQLMAIGGSYHSGFAFRVPGLQRNQINLSRSSLRINGVEVTSSYLEEGRVEAIIVIAEDFWTFVSPGEACKFYRTEPGCGSKLQFEFSLELILETDVVASNISNFPYDPFIFATDNYKRSYVFGEAPGRRYEVHLQNQEPTEAFQENFFGRGDDASDVASGQYFVSSNGMPWAINLPYAWQHPIEYLDVKYAYPLMHDFIVSSGELSPEWYKLENSNVKNIFSD